MAPFGKICWEKKTKMQQPVMFNRTSVWGAGGLCDERNVSDSALSRAGSCLRLPLLFPSHAFLARISCTHASVYLHFHGAFTCRVQHGALRGREREEPAFDVRMKASTPALNGFLLDGLQTASVEGTDLCGVMNWVFLKLCIFIKPTPVTSFNLSFTCSFC